MPCDLVFLGAQIGFADKQTRTVVKECQQVGSIMSRTFNMKQNQPCSLSEKIVHIAVLALTLVISIDEISKARTFSLTMI